MDQLERELVEQSSQIDTLGEYFAWAQRYEESIGKLEGHSQAKRPRFSIGNRQAIVARIALLEGVKNRLERQFTYIGGGDCNGENNLKDLWPYCLELR